MAALEINEPKARALPFRARNLIDQATMGPLSMLKCDILRHTDLPIDNVNKMII